MSTRPDRPDVHEASGGLLHAVLQNAGRRRQHGYDPAVEGIRWGIQEEAIASRTMASAFSSRALNAPL